MQILELEEFAQRVREGIHEADFNTKRHIFDLLDVRGTLAIENEERILYITCKLGEQQQSLMQTSHL
jgi:hypothetical protein